MNCATIILMSLLLGAVSTASAQDSTTAEAGASEHLLTLLSGISVHTVRDAIVSPLLYGGTQAPLVFSYRFRGSGSRHTLLLSYDDTQLHSAITRTANHGAISHYINNLHLNLEYSYATSAAVCEDLNTTCFVGARLQSFLNLRRHWFIQGKNHLSAEQMTGLGISVLTETALPRESGNVLRVGVNVPCIFYVLLGDRYNANVGEKLDDLDLEQNLLWQLFKRGDVVTFNKLIEIQADLSYLYYVSHSIGIELQYRLQYYSFAQYQQLFHTRVMSNQFLLGLTVRL
jgi:hypothetical protein